MAKNTTGTTKGTVDTAPAVPAKKRSIGEFFRDVRTEAQKVVWPTGQETMQTTILVLIMTTLLSIFFLGIDKLFGFIVQWLLSLAG